MTIFKDGKEIVEFYKDGKVINEIYHGDKLIFSTLRPGTILFESDTPQETTIEIPRSGLYEIICIGAGGGSAVGGYGNSAQAGGGSGGGFWLDAVVSVGTYSISVGTGGAGVAGLNGGTGGTGDSSYFGGLVANGGVGGTAGYITSATGGAGGSLASWGTITGITVTNVHENLAGKQGDARINVFLGTTEGGASIYPDLGVTTEQAMYGKGGRANGTISIDSESAGKSGYVFVMYKGGY